MKKNDFSQLSGQVICKDDFQYEESRKGWNRAIEKYPLAFVYCENNEHISNAIKWARNNEVEIRIRSGRHNYEGFSTGNDVLVIDVSKMKNITINEWKKEVTIAAGVLNEELYEALGKLSYPFPGGACPTVGVVGFVLGGGWGYSTRMLGLGCDSLIELRLINSDGELIVANERENNDLFWACRGAGGGNFGVVTNMTFKLPDKIDTVTLITGDCPNCKEDKIELIIEKWQREFEYIDKEFNGKISIYNSLEKGLGIKFVALYHGKKNKAIEILDRLNIKEENMKLYIEETTFFNALSKIQYSHPEYERYKSGGRFVYKHYDNKSIKEFINIIREREEGSIYSAITLYGLGGAVAEKEIESTAFFYREAKFILGIQSVWENQRYAPLNRKWINDKFNIIKKKTKGSFINFPLLEQEDYLQEYYGEYTNKLIDIKDKYDTRRVFCFEQSL